MAADHAREPEPGRVQLSAAFEASGMSLWQLWIECVGLTGDADELELDGFLHGLMSLRNHDRHVLVCAINEDRTDRGLRSLDPGRGEA